MKNIFVRLAAGAVIACAILPSACSRDDRGGGVAAPQAETGTLKMKLQTTSESGKVYRLRAASFSVNSFFGSNTITLSSETDPTKSVLESFLNPGSYQIQLMDGWFVEQVDELLGSATFVPATLLSSSFQFFDIQSDQETFVKFDFEVDGQRVGFGPPGRLIVGIGVHERGGNPGGLNPRRSLLETNVDAVSMITLEQALSAVERNSGIDPDPVTLYQRMIDTYASAPNGRIADAAHCGDETTDGVPSLNGYPLTCDRLEHQQFDNFRSWFPIAAVNRVDLAPTDGEHCGQQRLIFANNFPIGNGRMFIIVESQIPNPNPGCGVAACRPIADFWASLSTIDDAKERGSRIAQAFLVGTSELSAAGFGPFLSVENLGVGSGSIRTNNFDDFMWTLREFKVVKEPAGARIAPFPVDSAPHGALWDDTQFLAAGEQCRASFLDAIGGLLSNDPAEMAFIADAACLDAESPNNFSQSYPTQLSQGSGAFRSAIEARLLGTGLAPEDIAARAQFAGSCIGCHSEANGLSLGNGVTAPFSNSFVHISEQFTENCGDGTSCFGASSALTDVFLPRRLRALTDLLAISCSGGDAGVSVDGGASVDAGVSVDGGAPVDASPQRPPGEGGPSAVSPPSTGRVFQRRTLGGQPASVRH
jgi:hypothetical protein